MIYLYYAFDNRPYWFRGIWKLSEIARYGISRLPHELRYFVSQVIASVIYIPLAKTANLIEKMGVNVSNVPLSAYRHSSFYTM